VDDYVNIPDTNDLDFGTGGFSLSCWFKGEESVDNYPSIVTTQHGWGSPDYNGFSLRYFKSDEHKVTLHWKNEGNPIVTSGVLSQNALHHIGITRSGTLVTLYIDGASVDTGTCSVSKDIDLCSGGAFRIGGNNWDGAESYFQGFVNEVAVWDVALDADAVTALYNSGTPLDATADSGNYASSGDLQGYWRNDNDTTWTDRSTNSNNGTASGSPASIVLTEGLTSGRDSQGFYLTNTDENVLTLNGAEYVEVPDSDVLSFGDGTDDRPFSIEAWVKADDITDFQIISKGVYNTDAEWRLLFGGGNQLTFSLYDESGSNTYEIAYTTSALTAHEGIWTHVCGTYNGVGGASANAGIVLYVNGVSQSLSYLTNGTYVAMENLGADVQIGLNNTEYSDGKIDDVRIYSKALSSDEITKNYNAGKSKHS